MRAGPAADLFAAACVIYEMIAGRRAFEGASAIDVLYSVKHSEPPRLSGSPAISAIYNVICRAIKKNELWFKRRWKRIQIYFGDLPRPGENVYLEPR